MRFMDKHQLTNLVIRAQQGDISAQEEIIREKTSHIQYMALKLVGNFHDAEDVAQEAIINIHKNLRSLKDPSAFSTWIYRIVYNASMNKLNKDKNTKQEMDIDTFTDIAEEKREEFIPHEIIESEDTKALLRRLINELPEKRKKSLILYYFKDMSYEEIAQEMDISINTVSTNIMRAKQSLEKAIKDQI